jgi:hypothetical protein
MVPSWLIGSAVASLVILVSIQFSLPGLGMVGLLLPPFLAFWMGATAASVLDAKSLKRDASIIALVVFALLIAFLWRVQTTPGVQGVGGGPNM